MKRIALLIGTTLLAVLLTVCLVSCGDDPAGTSTEATSSDTSGTTTSTTTTAYVFETVTELPIIEAGATEFQVTYVEGADSNASFKDALTDLRKAFKSYGCSSLRMAGDNKNDVTEYEILLGMTDRRESQSVMEDLAFDEALIRIVGKKVVITSWSNAITAQALTTFIDEYMPGGDSLVLPGDLYKVVTVDLNTSTSTNKTYAEMATEVWDSFNDTYWKQNWVEGSGWWDAAEILETYIDAYEATGDEAIKTKMVNYANRFIMRNESDWSYNDFNDDIMWACIAFSRITLLTGNERFATIAKQNFDMVYERSWDEQLGGGIYWKSDNTTKNSCVNCPAAIAACYLAQFTGDDSYYTKAKEIMDWEFDKMFEPATGKVYDAYSLTPTENDADGIGRWSSTYNQGTFIGACTLLYQKYGEEIYMTYAQAAADFAMNELTNNSGILDNGENGGVDLVGFKGILTRWLYRYAKETNDINILMFLQNNADVAYGNRNAQGLIWTKWYAKTPDNIYGDANYPVFGVSTAVALMFNCQPWW